MKMMKKIYESKKLNLTHMIFICNKKKNLNKLMKITL